MLERITLTHPAASTKYVCLAEPAPNGFMVDLAEIPFHPADRGSRGVLIDGRDIEAFEVEYRPATGRARVEFKLSARRVVYDLTGQ